MVVFYCWGTQKMIDKISCYILSKYNWIKRDLIIWYFKTGRPEKQGYRKRNGVHVVLFKR